MFRFKHLNNINEVLIPLSSAKRCSSLSYSLKSLGQCRNWSRSSLNTITHVHVSYIVNYWCLFVHFIIYVFWWENNLIKINVRENGKIEGVIENGQSRDTDSIGYTSPRTKTIKTKDKKNPQKWTTQRHWQHWIHITPYEDKKNKRQK